MSQPKQNDVEYERARVINADFRDAAFNRKYYGCLLARAKTSNLTYDIIVALGTSGAVAAWNVWQSGPGSYVWKSLAAISTLVAIVKPFLNLPKEIERYSELVAGWAAVYYDLRHITIRMRTSAAAGEDVWCAYEPLQERLKNLGVKDDAAVNKKLQRRCFEEVNAVIPLESLWWPEEQHARSQEVAGSAAV